MHLSPTDMNRLESALTEERKDFRSREYVQRGNAGQGKMSEEKGKKMESESADK
jgi:hypothetical protein